MDEQSLNELLECSVCLERLDGTSKVLPCQHTFCRRCLDEIVSTKHELRCPECRTLVEIRVEDLPLNILLVRLLEGIKTKQATERSYSPNSGKQESTAHGSRSSRQSPNNTHACAKALYNYEGKDQGDLSFRKGDLILLRKKVDENWFHGELGSQHGFFPASYVQVIIPVPVTTPQCKALFDFEVNDAEKDCLAFKKEEYLTVIKRVDDNWVEGKKGEKIGIFPISFVEMNDAAKTLINYKAKVPMHVGRTPTSGDRSHRDRTPEAPPPGPDKNSSQRVSIPKQKRHSFHASSRHRSHSSHDQRHRRSLEINSSAGNLIIASPRSMSPPPLPFYNHESHEGAAAGKNPPSATLTQDVKVAGADGTSSNTQKVSPLEGLKAPPGINSVVYVALYNYKPTKEDEIELKKGDYYTVSDKCQDGWFRGQCLKSGHTGVFPGNYVQTVRHQSAFRAVGNSNVLNIRAKPQMVSAPLTTTAAAPTSSAPTCTSANSASAAGVTSASGSPQLNSRRSRSPKRSSLTPPRATSSPQPPSNRAKVPSPPSFVVVPSSSQSPSSTSVLSSSKSCQTTSLSSSSSTVLSRSVANSSDSRTVPTGASVQVFHSSHKSSSHSSHRSERSSSAHKSSSSTAASHQHVPKPGSIAATNYLPQRSGTSANHQGPAFLSPELLAMQKSMATSANITPPNVVIGPSGEGPSAAPQSSKDKKEKRDKEKISLVKRLTSGKSRKSKSSAVEDAGSAAAAAAGAASSLVLENNNTISHVRSGSCPSDTSSLLSVEGPLHVKTGSFDSSIAPPPPPQPSKPKRPNPPLREKCRCVVPYPPQSEIELELKVGDFVYVHKKRDDGWYKGTLQRTGKTGLFPGSFVEKCD
ncbi:E3 ubiquitin-protein ligase SH3RF3-like isoform X1 [Argopecten irradians]|uniref:E3 ubiquitin-protein ligase SH3RF3-like isoform X1 n=1 Tax=Argopecten irradians TaxID=31199 RepID=UPI00370FF91B